MARGPLRAFARFRSIYVLVLAAVAAATALAYYSYRYANDLARRGEQSIVDTNRDLAAGIVNRIEQRLVDDEQTLFDLIDVQNLRDFPRRWSDITRQAPTIESALVLDSKYHIVPDGYVSKKTSKQAADTFRVRFADNILPYLELKTLEPNQHKHLHREIDGRYHLLAYTRHDDDRRTYIVLETDLAYLVGEIFTESFEGMNARVYQVVDEHDNIVFGHRFSGIPSRFVVELPFATTLHRWRLRMAPREAPNLGATGSARRVFDVVLIGLSAAIVFVGLGVLVLAVRAERRTHQMKSDFIANVSHELKTPLSLIRMFGELLATGRVKGPEKAREYAAIVMRESERLTHLIDNVLDFSRTERGRNLGYNFQILPLSEVVTRGLEAYRHHLEHEGLALKVDLGQNLSPVRVDPNSMTLALLNLLDNAAKYAAEGKTVEVSLVERDKHVRLSVSDLGPGVAPAERERIFERFYRGNTARGKSVRGSGIGLALVKRVAEDHGGTVEVTDNLPKGSTFTLCLPACAHEAKPAPRREAQSA